MDEVIVRTATIDDLKVLLEFEQALIKAERPFDITIKKDPVCYYDLKGMLLNDDAAVVLAEYNGAVISSGYVVAKAARPYLDHEEYAYLGFMYTVPEYRGRGVNQKIVDRLKQWAISKGLREIRLTVYSDNVPAIKAYEKAGFKKHLINMRLDIENLDF